DGRVVTAVLRTSALDKAMLQDRAKVDEAARQLKAYLEANHPDMLPLKVEVDRDAEHASACIRVVPEMRAGGRDSVIDFDLVESPEYQEALNAQKDLMSIGKPPYVARAGEQEVRLENAEALTDFLDERGKKGVSVSRYKGLGEMNADELWETTMNPDARVLRQ